MKKEKHRKTPIIKLSSRILVTGEGGEKIIKNKKMLMWVLEVENLIFYK